MRIFIALGLIICLGEETAMAGNRYSVRTENFKGSEVYVLIDAQTGQEARVLPSVGNNCYSYLIQKGGKQIELFWAPPDPA